MLKKVLKNKLVSLGYGGGFVDNKLRTANFSVDTSKYTESELNQRIEVIHFTKPSAVIPRFFLNIEGKLQDIYVFDGRIDSFVKFSAIGNQLNLVDYQIAENLCIIGVTRDTYIKILLYNPDKDFSRYVGKTYEEIYGEEREQVGADYLAALSSGGRVSPMKAKDILQVLLTEYVIDAIILDDSNPRIRLNENAQKFAEMITSYSYKYINRRINRIEFVEKNIHAKYVGNGVSLGSLSNDPYLVLSEVNKYPNFILSKPTYVWLDDRASSGEEHLVIYTANEPYNQNEYIEVVRNKNDMELRPEIDKVTMQFSREMGYQVPREYIANVFRKINKELVIAPIDFIRKNTNEVVDYIEPLRYRYTVLKNRREFESVLYNSIEDNLNGRYRYRFVEKLSGIYMTIGNKLNYTDYNNRKVMKQSIADFNINFNAAIIKRETIIDARAIPQLLGYMYKDVSNSGIDMLPVPSIEVVFYFPDVSAIGREVEMYNGTSVDLARGDGYSSFNDMEANMMMSSIATKPRDPNEKYITVRYLDQEEQVLKENIIRDIVMGTTYTADMIPIINDKYGREWILAANQITNCVATPDNSRNIIEVHYIKKMAPVRINYLSKNFEELAKPVIRNMQVGEFFDASANRRFRDPNGQSWSLYESKPNKFTVTDDPKQNVLTLIYDVVKSDLIITYKTNTGVELKETEKYTVPVNSQFTPEAPAEIVDSNGLVWVSSKSNPSIIQINEEEEVFCDLIYDEKVVLVRTQFVDNEGSKISDDYEEYKQIGSEYVIHLDDYYKDVHGKIWHLKNIQRDRFIVSENEADNLTVISYESVNAPVRISMVNMQGERIREDIFEQAQIGTTFTPGTIKEIEDVSGRYWILNPSEEGKQLLVSDSEMQNQMTYTYKPMMTKATVQYIDDEGNNIIEPKYKEVQAGDILYPEIIQVITGRDNRVWTVSKNNEKEFKTNKYDEENIFKLTYEKKFVYINIEFKNKNDVTLKSPAVAQAQEGSEYIPSEFEKITADNGERLMIVKTNPQSLFVRENAKFTFIYDEIMAKVFVRYINVADGISIAEDMIYTSKLGGKFTPNINKILIDATKRRWDYVGSPSMDIIVREEESENLIELKYEKVMSTITLHFVNEMGVKVHKDVEIDEQVGGEVAITRYDNLIEDNGMGWKLKNMSRNSITVLEDRNQNEVTSTYVPLIVPVSTRYIDEDGNELSNPKIDNIQVGLDFQATPIDRVTDKEGKIWIYSNIEVKKIKVVEQDNKVNIKYIPLMTTITEKFVNLENVELTNIKVSDVQVGSTFRPEIQDTVRDEDGKGWIYKKSSPEKLVIREDASANKITNVYEKYMIDVMVKYLNEDDISIAKSKSSSLQIGSLFKIEPPKVITDENKLSFILSDENNLDVVISPNRDEDIFEIRYKKYLVNVTDKCINTDTKEDIVEPKIHQMQVGSSYTYDYDEIVKDDKGREWIVLSKAEGAGIFAKQFKAETITVSEDEAKNITIIKYKPKLAYVTIKYQNRLGNPIKPDEKKQLQVGVIFNEFIEQVIEDNFGTKWAYNSKNSPEYKVSENESENEFALQYEEKKGLVTLRFVNDEGKEFKDSVTENIQIGTKYTPQFDMIITDTHDCVWEYSKRDRDTFDVKEDDKENVVVGSYSPLMMEVKIFFQDLFGKEISKSIREKAQLGSVYSYSANEKFESEDGLYYNFKKVDPPSITIKEPPLGSTETPNIIKAIYDSVNSDVEISYVNSTGSELRSPEKVHLQVGSKYSPNPPKFITDWSGNEWSLSKDNEVKDEIIVSQNEADNKIQFIYEVAKADVIIRYVNLEGMVIKPEEKENVQVGTNYIAKPEEYILDQKEQRWKLINCSTDRLKVGSINNIITMTYQEDKARVTIHYENQNGARIKGDDVRDEQIGLVYSPKVSQKVLYTDNEIWRYKETKPEFIKISENILENEITIVYTNERQEVEDDNKKVFVNPFANTLTDEEKAEMQMQENDNKKSEDDSLFTLSTNDNVVDDSSSEDIASTQNITNPVFTSDSNINPTVSNISQSSITQDSSSNVPDFEFEDQALNNLARSMKLTNSEKIGVNKLNQLNDALINELNRLKEQMIQTNQPQDFSLVEKMIVDELEIVKSSLTSFMRTDISGSKTLKLYENIMDAENNSKELCKVQDRKAILITDYFSGIEVGEMDKVTYVVERGKNRESLQILPNKLVFDKKKQIYTNAQEIYDLQIILEYERILLDNCYKAREPALDNYFVDPNAKASMPKEFNDSVVNTLIKHALIIFKKSEITTDMKVEVEAIYRLLSKDEQKLLKKQSDQLDGNAKRNANRILGDIARGK